MEMYLMNVELGSKKLLLMERSIIKKDGFIQMMTIDCPLYFL